MVASLFWQRTDLHSVPAPMSFPALLRAVVFFCPSASALEVTTAGVACGLLSWYQARHDDGSQGVWLSPC